MRQAVQALAVVTLDVPAAIPTADLPAIIADAIRTGSHAVAEPVGCVVRSVREEAAIFNNNEDQWVVGPHGIYKSDAPQFQIGFAYSQGFGQPFPDRDEMPGRIAEALNLAAGAPPLGVADVLASGRALLDAISADIFTDAPECEEQLAEVTSASGALVCALAALEQGSPQTIPEALRESLAWAVGMAAEAIAVREDSDDPEDFDDDMLALHHEALARARGWLNLPTGPAEAASLYTAATMALDTLTRLLGCGEDWDAVFALRYALARADAPGAAPRAMHPGDIMDTWHPAASWAGDVSGILVGENVA